jgi:hypothetical protein
MEKENKKWYEYLQSTKPISNGEDVVDSIVVYTILACLIAVLLF